MNAELFLEIMDGTVDCGPEHANRMLNDEDLVISSVSRAVDTVICTALLGGDTPVDDLDYAIDVLKSVRDNAKRLIP